MKLTADGAKRFAAIARLELSATKEKKEEEKETHPTEYNEYVK